MPPPGFLARKAAIGEHSPSARVESLRALLGGASTTYGPGAAFAVEALLTFFFLLIILGSTDRRAPAGLAPIAIGLGLTLIHLVGIPVTGVSVNPARSTGPALFVGGWALQQLWLFWVAPLLGGVFGAMCYRWLSDEPSADVVGTGRPA